MLEKSSGTPRPNRMFSALRTEKSTPREQLLEREGLVSPIWFSSGLVVRFVPVLDAD
jgi:hypothetical protein